MSVKQIRLQTTEEIDDTDAIRLLNVIFSGGTFSTWLNPDGPGIVVRGDAAEIEKLERKRATLFKIGLVVEDENDQDDKG